MTKEKLYPINYNGKVYRKKDCNSIFASFYTTQHALRFDGSVYVSDGMSITPDGEWKE